MSHEINNPLSVIIGKSSILKNFVGKGKIAPEFEIHFTKINEMCDRISKIIKNLRNFARDGSNDPFDYFDINRFFADISELTRLKLDKKAITFKFTNNTSITKLYGKEIPLSQVIINLINNSADAIETLPEKWVELKMDEDEKNVFFHINDSGNGIDARPPIQLHIRLSVGAPSGTLSRAVITTSATEQICRVTGRRSWTEPAVRPNVREATGN